MKSHSHAFLSPRDMIGFALLAAMIFVVFLGDCDLACSFPLQRFA